jgi:hypothetical protein
MRTGPAPAIAALLLASCAGPRVPPRVTVPPAGYDRPVAAILKVESPERVAELCKSPEPLMCAIGAYVIAPSPWLYADDPYAVALWHELAHVLGWPADHPGAKLRP